MEYKRVLSDDEMKILENDLLDVKDWIDKAIEGKINNCKKRIEKDIVQKGKIQELVKLDHDLVKAFLKQPDYKCRKDREAEVKK